jgi:uncharacterized radical SAM superfamily Fe-S cluster-containing enzyme
VRRRLLGAKAAPPRHGDVFHIVIKFVDRHELDLRSVRKSCLHKAHPDGRRAAAPGPRPA